MMSFRLKPRMSTISTHCWQSRTSRQSRKRWLGPYIWTIPWSSATAGQKTVDAGGPAEKGMEIRLTKGAVMKGDDWVLHNHSLSIKYPRNIYIMYACLFVCLLAGVGGRKPAAAKRVSRRHPHRSSIQIHGFELMSLSALYGLGECCRGNSYPTCGCGLLCTLMMHYSASITSLASPDPIFTAFRTLALERSPHQALGSPYQKVLLSDHPTLTPP